MTNSDLSRDPPAFLVWMDAFLDGLANICRLVTGVSLVVLTVIFGWLVFGRYVLNATPTWVEQVALLLVMVIAFLGAAVGVHDHTHISVAVLRTAVSAKVRLVLVIVSDVLMVGFGALMIRYGAELTLFKWDSQIPLIQMPEGLRSLPLTICGGLIVLFSLGHIVRLLFGNDMRTDSIQ
ncbi:TRAP transporter small permease [Aliiruegeria lutimaris]|uniref:TRAP transporter small permease protein n=1 Tax=Aliiruegeria lutimaris TaxID=571298 RepID=A0A1G8UPB2_9RHOB|nr:TRAP transporter small permease [Aliiruegeria lutimaris]SDJ55317.1 TRAP-type C4-dicarboxylate transport system, small permease component [Aliiruegeria lutimaris]